jgi:cytochrome c553
MSTIDTSREPKTVTGIDIPTAQQKGKWNPVCAGVALLFSAMMGGVKAAEAPPGASSCSGCHAANASVETPVPGLAGRPAAEITAAMDGFRAGQRPATVMDRIAKGFSDVETAAIAAWYAEQKD